MRKSHKSKNFEHSETASLREAPNWDDFPNSITMDTSIGQASVSPLPGNGSPIMDLSKVVVMAGNVSFLVIYLRSSIKRGPVEPMKTDEVDTASMPKKKKVE